MKKILYSLLSLALLVGCSSPATQQKEVVTPEDAIEVLKAGNKRFVENNIMLYNKTADYAKNFTQGQKPHTAVVACSDSRVPVELLFDQGFGDVFVIRTAGNTLMDNDSRASVDYAVNHLGVKLVVVLGHTSCGAVTEVVKKEDAHAHKVENDEAVGLLISRIAEPLAEYKGQGLDVLDSAIEDNAKLQVASIASQANIVDRVSKGELKVIDAIYNISTGEVEF